MKSLDNNKTKELDKMVKLFIEAWYIRTLECIDMDNGDRVIPPPTKKEWELGVKKDLDKLLTQQRTELLEQILNLECLKEEKYTIVGAKFGTESGEFEEYIGDGEKEWKDPRNELRKEIKDEINKL